MTRGKKTKILAADKAGVETAARLIGQGALVAFPTETVYGLGADARNSEAVAGIYEAKSRPSFNPLIVHLPDIEAVARYGVVTAEAETFLTDGWPAGLTMVLPQRADAGLSPLVTAGLPSVALRVPSSPVALALLKAFSGPIAAPSANPSGRISPTLAEHVLGGLDGKIAAVLDGGPTQAGLESTILGFEGGVHVLREGAFPIAASVPRFQPRETVNAPGQLSSHYAPEGSVRLNATSARDGEWHIGFGDVAGDVSLSRSGDLKEAAAQLFAILHNADKNGVERLAVAPIPDTGIGRAINDRLRRAAAPRD